MSDTDEPPIDPPLTKEEIAVSHRLADAYLRMVRKALARFPRAPRSRRPFPDPEPGERIDRLMPTLAWRIAVICGRGECRRVRACRYGGRPGDRPFATQGGRMPPAPCFEALPRVVQLALPFAVQRRCHPEMFRDPRQRGAEDEAIRTARIMLVEGETAWGSPYGPVEPAVPVRPEPGAPEPPVPARPVPRVTL
ncbi:hypothetical protein [Jiella sp. M17.18]|uniref:hypothetical protein n=1 Tax=Jiella sp. M17.18 TaxID=3234247 RepID=UPI0034E04FA2